MNALALADQTPVIALLRPAVKEPGIPRQRYSDRPPIHQVNHKRVFSYIYIVYCGNTCFNHQRIHAKSSSVQLALLRIPYYRFICIGMMTCVNSSGPAPTGRKTPGRSGRVVSNTTCDVSITESTSMR